MAHGISQELLNMVNEFGMPMLKALPNIFYQGSTILDLWSRKKSATKKKLEERNLLDKGAPQNFTTIAGREIKVGIPNGHIMTKAQMQGHDIYINHLDKVHSRNGGGAFSAKFGMADVGVSMQIAKRELQEWDKLRRTGMSQLMLEMDKKWKMLMQDMLLAMAYEFYFGRGVLEDEFSAGYNSSPSYGTGTEQTHNEIEGIFNYILDPDVDYGGLDVSKYPFWKPFVYDFSSLSASNKVLGYSDSTNLNTRSKLMDSSNSQTANVPPIIDIIKRVIRKTKWQNKKCDVVLVNQDLYDTVVDAKESKAYKDIEMPADKTLSTLLEEGYDDDYTMVAGVPVVADTTAISTPDSKEPTEMFPENVIVPLFLDSIDIYMNELDKFEVSEWKEVPDVWNALEQRVTATVQIVDPERFKQTLIKMPEIDFDS